MTAAKTTGYLGLERKIASNEGGGMIHRWQYGRKLLAAKADRKQLPHGMLASLIADATKAGMKVSEREIQRRIQFATIYPTEATARKAIAEFGSWTELVNTGFPAIEIEQSDPPDAWDQISPIPGLAPVLTGSGRKVPLIEATVLDVKAYRDMYRQIHENYAKRLDLIERALATMHAGSDDPNANALEAWRRGAGDDLDEES